MARPLTKMSDAEFLRALRAWRSRAESRPLDTLDSEMLRDVGAPLSAVFEAERRELAQRCLALTLRNMTRMLEAPCRSGEWWAPDGIVAYVNEARLEEFVLLTDAAYREKGYTVQSDTLFVPAPGSFYVASGEIARPLVWWARRDIGQREVPLVGLAAEHTLPATLTEWRRIARDGLGIFSFDPLLEWDATCDWTEGAIDHADPEPRAVILVQAHTKLCGSPEQIVSPWGRIERDASVPLTDRISLMNATRDLSTFAYEVPYLVDEDEVLGASR